MNECHICQVMQAHQVDEKTWPYMHQLLENQLVQGNIIGHAATAGIPESEFGHERMEALLDDIYDLEDMPSSLIN